MKILRADRNNEAFPGTGICSKYAEALAVMRYNE